MTEIKICGMNDAEGFDAACAAGADYVGFVFFPASPRHVAPDQVAALSARKKDGPIRVGLFVDADDAAIAAVLAVAPLGMLQLHGDETPARCADLRRAFGLPVMKAIGIATAADLAVLADYAPVVERFLLDAKPPPGEALPGGNAGVFDWSVLAGAAIARPWLLAGGLHPGNVAGAIATTAAPGVDVSSGVERARGVKDAGLIAAFCRAARG